jgi:hypothetical protein
MTSAARLVLMSKPHIRGGMSPGMRATRWIICQAVTSLSMTAAASTVPAIS